MSWLSRTRTRVPALVVTAITVASLTGTVPATADPAEPAAPEGVRIHGVLLTPYEARLVRLVNKARTRRELPRLKVTACAEDFARSWTKVMAREDSLYHNPDLTDLWKDKHCDRTSFVAENVGYAWGNARVVFEAYMASPGHKANILRKEAAFIGIGAITLADGKVFNTMNFTNGGSVDYGKTKVLGENLTGH